MWKEEAPTSPADPINERCRQSPNAPSRAALRNAEMARPSGPEYGARLGGGDWYPEDPQSGWRKRTPGVSGSMSETVCYANDCMVFRIGPTIHPPREPSQPSFKTVRPDQGLMVSCFGVPQVCYLPSSDRSEYWPEGQGWKVAQSHDRYQTDCEQNSKQERMGRKSSGRGGGIPLTAKESGQRQCRNCQAKPPHQHGDCCREVVKGSVRVQTGKVLAVVDETGSTGKQDLSKPVWAAVNRQPRQP